MADTLAKQRAVAIAPKFTAFASAVGSALNVYLILRRRSQSSDRSGGPSSKRTYHRLILGMSLCDFTASVAWFFTTWPIPAGTSNAPYGASGTQGTCSAQAFFAQFSLSTVMYNASLALYYVLVIVRGWKDADIVKIEPWLHLHSMAWGLGTAVASLSLTLFNPVQWDCWISSAPLGCQETWNSTPESPPTCVRGDNGSLYQWAFYYAPLWVIIVIVTLLMYYVYASVRDQEAKMNKYAHAVKGVEVGGNQEAKRAQSLIRQKTIKLSYHKRIAGQCFAYVGAFYFTWLFPTIFQIVIVSTGEYRFPLLFLTALFVPIQGLLNMIVFIRPKYVRHRRKNRNQFFLLTWLRVLGIELGVIGDGTNLSTQKHTGGTDNSASPTEKREGDVFQDEIQRRDRTPCRLTRFKNLFLAFFAKCKGGEEVNPNVVHIQNDISIEEDVPCESVLSQNQEVPAFRETQYYIEETGKGKEPIVTFAV